MVHKIKISILNEAKVNDVRNDGESQDQNQVHYVHSKQENDVCRILISVSDH